MNKGAEDAWKLIVKYKAILWHEDVKNQHDVDLKAGHFCGQGYQEQEAVHHCH
jgi:hypothetical protein